MFFFQRVSIFIVFTRFNLVYPIIVVISGILSLGGLKFLKHSYVHWL